MREWKNFRFINCELGFTSDRLHKFNSRLNGLHVGGLRFVKVLLLYVYTTGKAMLDEG